MLEKVNPALRFEAHITTRMNKFDKVRFRMFVNNRGELMCVWGVESLESEVVQAFNLADCKIFGLISDVLDEDILQVKTDLSKIYIYKIDFKTWFND